MAALSVRVLGEFAVDGRDARTLADRKARQLLRWLALARGKPVASAALADAIWGVAQPARPADQLAVLASRLRRTLGSDAIERTDHGYRLRYDWLDVDELDEVLVESERTLAEGNVTRAVAAARIGLALVRGPLPDPGTDAGWVLAEHDAIERRVRRLRHTAAAAMLAGGAWVDALDLAEADARSDPYDETAVRAVMRANAAGGRPAIALAVYAGLRTTLAEELGAEPAPETAALHEAILRAGGHHQPASRRADVTLVGRASQLDHLDSLAHHLSPGTTRVAVVVGEAGIGKTTLLTAWSQARRAAGTTVLFGTCGPLERSAPLDAVLVAVGEHVRRSQDAAALLGEDARVLAPLLGLGGGRRDRDPSGAATMAVDPALGSTTLYAALTNVVERIGGSGGVVLVVDDAHLAGPALVDWIAFATRRRLTALVVAAVRPGEGEPFASADLVTVGPLDATATAELVGAERANELYSRSRGHPLFLSELARMESDDLPSSLVAAVAQVCDQLGPAADLVRTAAVLGTELDLDLLASITGRPPLDVLADVERAQQRQLLVEEAGRYSFRHELVREALAADTAAARVTLLHREAAVALDRRPAADPVVVAEHARLGGDLALAGRSLRVASARAAERFEHATAEDLLDQSLHLHADPRTLLARARVRIRRGEYAGAEADVLAAQPADSEGHEVRAWAAYFDRRFDDAVAHAADGELAADDPTLRARCQVVGGRTLHARGDLDDAQRLLVAAAGAAVGADRLTAAAWLGVLRAHRSQTDQAIDLLRPATGPGVGVDHTSATLHALLFTGHAHALAGRPQAALTAFERYTEEVEHRQVPRFGGRGTNFSGWVLRNIGAAAAARDAHEEALAFARGDGTTEVLVAALEDLAEDRLLAGDPEAATRYLDEAGDALVGDLVFGWRLAMKLALLRARLAVTEQRLDDAFRIASELRASAERISVPRYASVAGLLVHQARALLGEPVDLDHVWRDLSSAESSVAIEAWWWAGETGAALHEPSLLSRAESLAEALAQRSGSYGDALRTEAGRRITTWRLRPP